MFLETNVYYNQNKAPCL